MKFMMLCLKATKVLLLLRKQKPAVVHESVGEPTEELGSEEHTEAICISRLAQHDG
jgi:hypothetical protein